MRTPPQQRSRPLSRSRWMAFIAEHGGLPDRLPLKRGGPRQTVGFGVAVLTFDGDRGPVSRTLPLLNVSPTGVMVKGQRRLPVHTKVRIELLVGDQTHELCGRVAHSTQTVGGYKIGIELNLPA
jgi:hypothetical protein